MPKSERDKGGRLQRLEWPWKTKAQTAITEYQRLKRHTFINLLILQGVISWWVRKISQNCCRLLRLHSLSRQVLVFQALCPNVRSRRHGKSFCIYAPCNHAAYTASSHNPFDSIEIASYMACLVSQKTEKRRDTTVQGIGDKRQESQTISGWRWAGRVTNTPGESSV